MHEMEDSIAGKPGTDFFCAIIKPGKMKKLLLPLFAAFALAACSDDETWQDPAGPDQPESTVIEPVTPSADTWTVCSFEASEGWLDIKGAPAVAGDITVVGGAVAGTYHGVMWAGSPDYPTEEIEYMGNVYDGLLVWSADGSIGIGSYYSDGTGWGAHMDSWGGFVLSKNYDRTATAIDLKNQFSVWAEKGARGTETFLAAYDFSMMGGAYSGPKIVFTMPRIVCSLSLANSTTLYPYESSKPDFTFTVRITGYDAAGQSVGEIDCPLVADGKRADDWVEVSTESLGPVSALKFKVVSNDAMAPAYFCLDDLKVKEYVCVSFEPVEGVKDIEGVAVQPGEITIDGFSGKQTYQEVFWAKSITNYADYLVGGAYDGYLFSSTDENVWFGTYYASTEYGDQWGGFALTGNYGKTASELDYADQFTVWADAGVGGSGASLLGYEDTYTGGYACPMIEIAGEPVRFRHCYLANTALTHSYVPTAVDASTYYYKVVVTGWLEERQTGSVECLLVDGKKKLEGWQYVDLTPLGRVDRLSFSTDTNDRNNYGPLAPAFFALDDLGYYPAK